MNPIVLAAVVMLVAILLILVRALLGPTMYDRILAVNAMGTKTVIFMTLLGFISLWREGGETDRIGFLDIALLYALINFVVTIAVLKYVEFRRLS